MTALLSVTDFGATGDGSTDDTGAIREALAAGGSNRTLVFPTGRYRVTGPLGVSGTAQQTIRGEGLGSQLYFEGSYSDGLRCEDVTNFTVRDLFLAGPASVDRGLHVTAAASTEHVLIENVYADGFSIAIAIGADTAADVSEVSLVHCIGQGSRSAAFVLGDGQSANVLDIRFLGCTARNSGVGVFNQGAGYSWHGGSALGNSVADFQMTAPSSHPTLIQGVRSEGSRRFWDYDGGRTYATTVTLQGVFVASFSDPDGCVVHHACSSPLTLIGCTFWAGSGGGKPTAMRLGIGPDKPLSLVAINLVTDSARPFGESGPNLSATLLGCHRILPDTGAVKLGTTVLARGR